ncbi:MAG: T9SS type A sorting domain-containing protein [Microscillaceae bacterium]|nr:T9SS type A sorting domain-containing protein [Microscillaceae bacterium]
MLKNIYTFTPMRRILLIFCLSICTVFKAYTQDDNCGGATVYNLGAQDILNVDFDISNAFALSAAPGDPLNCITSATPLPSATRDAWASFNVPVTGKYVIQFSSNSPGEDAILAVYTGDCGSLSLITCINNFQGENGTESLIVNLSQGATARIRVISTLGATSDGKLTIYKGDESFGDICSSAAEVSVGTCDFDFNIGTRFFNHEGRSQNAGCAAFTFNPNSNTLNRDGWMRFTASETGIVGVEYTNLDQNAALEIYEGDCANLSFLTCTNVINGVGPEALEFSVVQGSTYFIRVLNIANANAMQGGVCIFPVISRNLLTDPFLSSPSLSLGDCNVKVNILASFSNTPETGVFCTNPAQDTDAWLTFSQNTGVPVSVRMEYSTISGHSPSLMVLDAPILNDANLIACSNLPTSVIDFTAISGQVYYIRVVRPIAPTSDMLGSLCVYKNEFRAENNFYTAIQYATDGTNCGEQFNILGSFNGNGGSHLLNPATCMSGINTNDAWARFQTGASPADLIIEYNNDNSQPTVSNNVALVLYKGETTFTDPTNIATEDCSDAFVATPLGTDTTWTFNITDPGFTLTSNTTFFNDAEPCTGTFSADAWVRYDASDGEPFTVVYENTSNDAILNILGGVDCNNIESYDLCSGGDEVVVGKEAQIMDPAASPPIGGNFYYIRVVRKNPGTMNGKLTIYKLSEEKCSDIVPDDVEGSEIIPIAGSDLEPNTNYYIRVVNNLSVFTPSTTTGTLCIREDSTAQGDICTVAVSTLVGNCDQSFDIPASFNRQQTGVTPTCAGLATNYRDGWIKFTANSSKTTIQYSNLNEDVAIAVYRGACGASLIPLGCVNNVLNSGTPETIKVNTIVGLEYFVQIISIDGDPMEGRFCIFNTAERDVCEDNNLVTRLVGDCNLAFDIPVDFQNTGTFWRDYDDPSDFSTIFDGDTITRVDRGCDNMTSAVGGVPDFTVAPTNNSRDAWIRFIGNGNEVTVSYQNKEVDSNPAILVYTAIIGPGPVDCGLGLNGAGNLLNQLACADTANDSLGISREGLQTEAVSFQTQNGEEYIIRIMDIVRPDDLDNGKTMTGSLCISAGNLDNNTCDQARVLQIGACSVPLNVFDGLNTCSDPAIDALSVGCASKIINSGETWKYEDSGADLGTAWRAPAFDDSAWNTGESQFGFGDNDEETLITPGRITYYFRKQININTANYSSYVLKLLRDDGIAVYINGTEVHRNNLAAGAASTAVAGFCREASEDTFVEIPIAPGVFINGNNVIAVEIHNCAAGDVDLSFDFELLASANQALTCAAGDAWATFTVPNAVSVDSLPDNQITIQYDNRNFTFDEAADISLAVFSSTNACDPADLILESCSDILGTGEEGVEQVTLTLDASSLGEQYYIRVINKTAGKTAFGKLCVSWGETLAQPDCPPANDYGALEGDFKSFEVLGAWNAANELELPTSTITTADNLPCVIGGTTENILESNTPPIRSQGWVKFTVPTGFSSNGVTVQYDNGAFISGFNTQNAAVAVYTMPEDPTGATGNCGSYLDGAVLTNPDNPNANEKGLELVGCINSVFEGTESLSFPLYPDSTSITRTYFVRVMNITGGTGTAPNMPGRIRIFPFAPCEISSDLVVHGDFENWPAISDPVAAATYFGIEDPRTHTKPLVTGANRTSFIEDYAHYASDYGYQRDLGNNTTTDQNLTNPYSYLRSKQNEMDPEGLYAISQSPWSYKKDWYGYGKGYSGYGGNIGVSGGFQDPSYCASGSFAVTDEPCVPVLISESQAITSGRYFNILPSQSAFETQLNTPRFIPSEQSANFMIVNGSYSPTSNLPPGKIWCQTIHRGTSFGSTSYYVFSVWVQNMLSGDREFIAGLTRSDPFLRMTICDMEDPNNEGSFPSFGASGTVIDSTRSNEQTRLPGVTTFYTPAGSERTFHNPAPPASHNFEFAISSDNAASRQQSYGAATACNLPGEPQNHRLKVLGSSFLIREKPDRWSLVRCIYKADPQVRSMNICIENLSLEKNGNDFGIDDIQFGECTNADPASLDRLLRGDPCELGTGVTSSLLDPLKVFSLSMLDFTGKLIGEQVYLNWLVTNEQEVAFYEIQRAVDGSNFMPIGRVDAASAATGLVEYDYLDSDLPEDQFALYYRLRIVSVDGQSSFGPPVRILLEDLKDFDLKLIPNPQTSGENVDIEFNVPEGNALLSINNLMGVPLMTQPIRTNQGVNKVSLSTKSLAAGIYIIRLEVGGKSIAKRLVIH